MIDIRDIVDIGEAAGREIMDVYSNDLVVGEKCDRSPLTEADQRSHELILRELSRRYPDIPVISEEGRSIPYLERRTWKQYWLVDPLDGTKEFIGRNGEFTVNIALVEDGLPRLGVIVAPVVGDSYAGSVEEGAWKSRTGVRQAKRIAVRHPDQAGITVVESRSHPSDHLESYLKPFNVVDRVRLGSSLKFCTVAEGNAHLYPRLGPMMDWDAGAGEALVVSAGGVVTGLNGGQLEYNSQRQVIPSLICACNHQLIASNVQE